MLVACQLKREKTDSQYEAMPLVSYLSLFDPVIALLLRHLLHVKVLSVDIATANLAIEVTKGDGSSNRDKVERQSDEPKSHPLSIMRRRRRCLLHDLVVSSMETLRG